MRSWVLYPLGVRATFKKQNKFFLKILTLVYTCTCQLSIEPELKTNRPRKKLLPSEPPEERLYEPEGVGMMLKKGDEVRDALILSYFLMLDSFSFNKDQKLAG